MKKILKKCVCGILAAILISSMSLPVFSGDNSKTVKIAFYSMPGLQNIDESGNLSGYMYDYLQQISKYTGWKYEFFIGDFYDCLSKLEAGELDFMGGMQITEERKATFEFPNYACGEMYTALYVKNDNFNYAYGDTASFNGLNVGVITGIAGNKDFEAYCEENNITVNIKEFSSDDMLMEALNNGEVEAICSLCSNTNLRCITGFSYKNFYMMASKGKTELVRELDKALEQIKVQNPFYEKNLWEQYFPVKNETTPVYTKAEQEYIKNAQTITAVYSKGMLPLERYNEETGEFDGITADLFQLISEISGLDFNFIAEDNYANAYKRLKNEDVQIICSTARDYEWAELYNIKISQEYLNAPIVMVSKDQVFNKKTVVALPSGLYLSNLIKKNFTNYEYIEYPSATDCFDAVAKGVADATFADTYLAREFMKNSKYSSMKATALNGYAMRYCVGFSSDVDDLLVSIIDKTLACISDDQINEFIVADTMTYKSVSLIDLIYQNPVESILLIMTFFALFIILLIVILRNKTKYAKKLYTLLNLDALTKAPSFTKFRNDANKLISKQPRSEYMLIYMNISKFKDINYMYGYTVGDALLKCISDNLKSRISSDELFSRMYSDRFIVFVSYEGEADFVKRYNGFLDTLYIMCNERKIPCRPHFTAGVYPLSSADNDINLAIDRACYAHEQCSLDVVKDYVFYNEDLNQKILAEHMLEAGMEDALANEDFKVYYQPKINSITNSTEGAEALIRWQQGDGELMSPSHFIPLFEKNGFILKTDYYVFEKVCAWIADRKSHGKTLFPVSCNFSRLHLLNDKFPDELSKIAQRFGVTHSLLEIEITETIAVEDIEIAKLQLKRLKDNGFSISIDDFGSGYSSLGILSEIPFDVIKLDRSLIYNAAVSDSNRLILSGIISTIQSLGKKIVSEGVEEQRQIDLLKSFNCYTIQGYYYSKPLSEAEFDKKY